MAKRLAKPVRVMNNKPLLILSLALNVFCGALLITILATGSGTPLGQAATNSQQVVTNTVIKQMPWKTVEAPAFG